MGCGQKRLQVGQQISQMKSWLLCSNLEEEEAVVIRRKKMKRKKGIITKQRVAIVRTNNQPWAALLMKLPIYMYQDGMSLGKQLRNLSRVSMEMLLYIA